ncbi:golgin subfamily A member 6-like protein 22 [Ptychodera flava]|uniref:golgin subfamily A member 6-like protein 22 n=1 Tax=Ptychodera flava TaxID=63121 RepID=UPI00396A7DF5
MIRTKEKQRQKVSLEEKMTQRKLRKTRMAAEQRQKELMEVEQVIQNTWVQDDAGIDENRKKEMEAEIARRNAEFERELQVKKQQLSEAELELILAEHKQNMLELARDFERNEERQKLALAEKIAKRKKKRAAWKAEKEERAKLASKVAADAVMSIDSGSDTDEIDVISDRIKKLTREIDRRESTFVKEVASKKHELQRKISKQTCLFYRLVAEHKKEMQRLVHKLTRDKERQRRILEEKLGARRKKKLEEAGIGSSEGDDIEMQIRQRKLDFEEEMKRKRPHISEEEYQRLLAEHRAELDRLGKKLDKNKERQRLALLEKLANRKRRREMRTTEDEERAKLLAAMKSKEVLSEGQLKLFEDDIKQYKVEGEDELKEKKSQLSPEEYERLLAQHRKDMEELDTKLQEEKDKMKKSLEEKIAERKDKVKKRGKKNQEDGDLQEIEEEMEDIETEMKGKQKEFEERTKKGDLSDEDYARLLREHEDEMERLKAKLDRQKDRQRQTLLEKIAERKRKKKMEQTEEEQRAKLLAALKNKETLSEEQLQMLQEDIEQYDSDMTKAISKKFDSGDVTQEEYESMMRKHQQNMVELQIKLRQEKSKLNAMLAEQVAALEGRRIEPSDSEDSDDEFNVIPEAQATQTQLWTTPVQSMALVMMPLLDEYPVRKKQELYTDPAIFRELDAHAIRVAQTVSLVTEPTFSSMVDTLVEPANSQLEKIRLIFRWITAQNCQEMDLHDAVDDTPLESSKASMNIRLHGLHCL